MAPTPPRVHGYLSGEAHVDDDGEVVMSATAVLSSVADSASTQPFLSALSTRVGFDVFNDSTVTLYLACASTATVSAFTVAILAGGFYENRTYTGAVSGIWASNAAGSARITDYRG